MAGFKVFAARRKFLKFKRPIESTLRKLGQASGFKGKFLEVYLVDSLFMSKNVLAFRAPRGFPRPDVKGKFIGEIYLNPDFIRERGEGIFYLFIHGCVHLLGYDHKGKSDRIKMEKKERQLLRKLVIGK